MLVDGSQQTTAPPRAALPAPGAAAQRRAALAFGGIGFELSWEPGFEFDLAELERDCCMPAATAEVAARVRCAIRWADDDLLRPIDVQPQGPSARSFRGLGTRGVLHEAEAGSYRAELTVTPTPRGCGAALRVLAGLVLESTGGLCLHAAAVEIDGGAVLFTGPSGAGKSTACELSGAQRCLAYDHVALVPTAQGYAAWRIPMGEAVALPLSRSPVLPLRGILCVRRGGRQPRIAGGDRLRALFDVRRAVDVADGGDGAEEARLAAAQHVCDNAPVARIETVLGKSIRPLLCDWLASMVHDA